MFLVSHGRLKKKMNRCIQATTGLDYPIMITCLQPNKNMLIINQPPMWFACAGIDALVYTYLYSIMFQVLI